MSASCFSICCSKIIVEREFFLWFPLGICTGLFQGSNRGGAARHTSTGCHTLYRLVHMLCRVSPCDFCRGGAARCCAIHLCWLSYSTLEAVQLAYVCWLPHVISSSQ